MISRNDDKSCGRIISLKVPEVPAMDILGKAVVFQPSSERYAKKCSRKCATQKNSNPTKSSKNLVPHQAKVKKPAKTGGSNNITEGFQIEPNRSQAVYDSIKAPVLTSWMKIKDDTTGTFSFVDYRHTKINLAVEDASLQFTSKIGCKLDNGESIKCEEISQVKSGHSLHKCANNVEEKRSFASKGYEASEYSQPNSVNVFKSASYTNICKADSNPNQGLSSLGFHTENKHFNQTSREMLKLSNKNTKASYEKNFYRMATPKHPLFSEIKPGRKERFAIDEPHSKHIDFKTLEEIQNFHETNVRNHEIKASKKVCLEGSVSPSNHWNLINCITPLPRPSHLDRAQRKEYDPMLIDRLSFSKYFTDVPKGTDESKTTERCGDAPKPSSARDSKDPLVELTPRPKSSQDCVAVTSPRKKKSRQGASTSRRQNESGSIFNNAAFGHNESTKLQKHQQELKSMYCEAESKADMESKLLEYKDWDYSSFLDEKLERFLEKWDKAFGRDPTSDDDDDDDDDDDEK
ncbi:hypothetical protein PoB_004189400 [Plakobranchus ocellatus]|uniref:Uncharacterized protein n=1 Tax=Plakobranchus ocellatus TaxID=259542 RepID=A0AAV4BAI1_9GAST|nr:hypothetical protein PoB_004189400 [Plakobranchus ocellatus]